MKHFFKGSKPILIAGATATGKSTFGIELAKKYNGLIINADSLQIYKQWKILTARPDDSEINKCPHTLYGHINIGDKYSAGHWLKEIKKELSKSKKEGLRPIIIGGTGLYFQLLLNGIAEIPDISNEIRLEADQLEQTKGKAIFAKELIQIDKRILDRIDLKNPVRTRRAWEVISETGKSLADWQDATPAPLLSLDKCIPINLVSNTNWLNNRIDKRFNIMMERGALKECENILKLGLWDEHHPSCKAIGAKELISHLQNGDNLKDAISLAIIQTRQYAKRQRTWFRSKMSQWHKIDVESIHEYIR